MTRKLFLLFSLFFLTFLLSGALPVLAQQEGVSLESKILPPDYFPPRQEPGFLGQDHNYSVVFRGNGEAVVSLKVIFTNRGEEKLSELSLRVPKVEPKDLRVYQVIREPQCVRYREPRYDPATGRYIPINPPICEEYQEPDYYGYYGDAKYQKADHVFAGDMLSIRLPRPIPADSSGSFFVYFRAFGYARKNIFGAFSYTFESLKVDDEIRNLQLGISTDSDLVLRGVKGKIDYRFETPELSGLGIADGAPQKSAAIDRFYSQIGEGKITKTASNLSPLESYTVRGAYAANHFRLYGKEILIGGLVALAFLVILALVARVLFKVFIKGKNLEVKSQIGSEKISTKGKSVILAASLSFVFSVFMAGYTVAIIFLTQSINTLIGYQYQTFITLFIVVISFCVYSLFLFGPAILLGAKKGIEWGIATFVLTIFWLISFLIVGVVVFFFIKGNGEPIPIFPLGRSL